MTRLVASLLRVLAVLALAVAVTLGVASVKMAKRPVMVRAPFITDAATLARKLKEANPRTEVLITETKPVHRRLELTETTVLTDANMPPALHLYAVGPVLPVGGSGLFVGLQRDSKILRFSIKGKFLGEVGKGTGRGPGELAGPFRARVDKRDSTIWVYCSGSALMQRFTWDGKYVSSIAMSIPNSFLRDFVPDADHARLFATFWDWESEAPIHVFSLDGRQLRSFGWGPLTDDAAGDKTTLRPRSMGFWENYAAGYVFLDGDRIVFAHSCPYQIDVYDTLGQLRKVILRPGKFVRPPGFHQVGPQSFVGPYTFQTTAIGITVKGMMVWSVSEKPGPEKLRYVSVLDVISPDGHLLYSRRWPELRWVWAFREDGSFLAAKRTPSGEDVIIDCVFAGDSD